MTDQLPERIWVGNFYFGQVSHREPPDQSLPSKEYISADTAIPRSQADAMVGDAYAAGQQYGLESADAMVAAVVASCAEVLEECGIDGSAFAQTFEEYRRGNAALQQIVQEAVEAEMGRCAASLDRRADGYDEAFSMSRPDEHATRTALVQTANELRRQAAAIRAPQETSE